MTLSRFGKPILTGWSHSQTLWVLAALTLPADERKSAYRDISELRGCSYYAVLDKARRIVLGRAEEAARARVLSGTVMVAVGRVKGPTVLPSGLRQPTKAELMAGR